MLNRLFFRNHIRIFRIEIKQVGVVYIWSPVAARGTDDLEVVNLHLTLDFCPHHRSIAVLHGIQSGRSHAA